MIIIFRAGKSTFINNILKKYKIPFQSKAKCSESQISSTNFEEVLVYNAESTNGLLNIHLFESIDFAADTNNDKNIESIANSLSKKHSDWIALDVQVMTEEERLNLDERIHCLIYLIVPFNFTKIDRHMILKVFPANTNNYYL